MSIYQEEHQIFKESVKKFSEKELLPYLKTWEKQKHFPNEVFTKLGAQGFLGILINEEWDGVGGDYILAGAWCEEIGRVPDVGMTTAINMHSVVVLPALQRFGSDAAKGKWLKKGVSGEAIGAYAFTEPGAGSDLTRVKTKAVKKGDSYILNGSKIFITNGARADFVLVLAKTDEAAGYHGFTTFVVDTKLPGFNVAGTLDKIGWHSSDTAELTFTDLELPESAVLGQPNKGWVQAMQSLEWERLMLTLQALGGATKCLEDTIRYVNERVVFDRSVGSFDHTQELIATLWAKLDSARALSYRCLGLLQAGKRCRKEISLAKLYVCELAIEVADRCLQLHGGYGYTTEFLPEKWLRDLRLNTIGGGTSEIMKRIALKELVGFEP